MKLGRLDARTNLIISASQNSIFLLEPFESLWQFLTQDHAEFKCRFLSVSKGMIQSLVQSIENSLPTLKCFRSHVCGWFDLT